MTVSFEGGHLTPSGEEWIATAHNKRCAEWAETAVLAFREACSGDMDETALYDLVANLGHLCDRLSAEYEDFDLTFEDMLDRAITHYEAEQGPGDDLTQSFEGDDG
jgi:hypothetical protein